MTIEVFAVKQFFLFAPASKRFFHVLAILHVENPREVGKTLRKPLIMVAFHPDAVPPPLVGAFVRSEEVGELHPVRKTDLVALIGIQKRARPQENKARPTLTERIADREVGNGERL